MQALFEAILYQPIYNAMVALYHIIPDIGIVIFILTLIIKLVLYPLTKSSLTSQKSLMEMQPKVEEIKKKYKEDQQQMAQELMKLYKENKVNPMASCLPLLIQIPVFLALFWVLRDGFNTEKFELLYSFISAPEAINPISLGVIDLSQSSIVLALLAGAAQFGQAYTMNRRRAPKKAKSGADDENMLSMMNKQMLYVMPVVTVLIGAQFPGGVTLYWFFNNLFMAGQQYFLYRDVKHEKEEQVVIDTK